MPSVSNSRLLHEQKRMPVHKRLEDSFPVEVFTVLNKCRTSGPRYNWPAVGTVSAQLEGCQPDLFSWDLRREHVLRLMSLASHFFSAATNPLRPSNYATENHQS